MIAAVNRKSAYRVRVAELFFMRPEKYLQSHASPPGGHWDKCSFKVLLL